MRERVAPPTDGVLFTTRTAPSQLASALEKYSDPVNTSPQLSSQFSANVACKCTTASPSTRTMVSRHAGWPLSPFHHWSAIPAPPIYPPCPSIISSSRWVRLLKRGSLLHFELLYQETRPPAASSFVKKLLGV